MNYVPSEAPSTRYPVFRSRLGQSLFHPIMEDMFMSYDNDAVSSKPTHVGMQLRLPMTLILQLAVAVVKDAKLVNI